MEQFELKSPEEMTKEETELELKEVFKNIRKIKVLEKQSLKKWTKEELLEMMLDFNLWKCGGGMKVTTIKKFVKKGQYRKGAEIFEEYKIIKKTKEIKDELKQEKIKLQRGYYILKDLEFSEWSKYELLNLIKSYDKYVVKSIKNNEKVLPIYRYAGKNIH